MAICIGGDVYLWRTSSVSTDDLSNFMVSIFNTENRLKENNIITVDEIIN